MPEWKGALSLPLFDPLPLVTPRLELRPLRPADADALFSVYSDPVATRYWSSPAWTTPEQAVERIELDRLLFEEGSALRLALQPRGEPAIIGTVSLFAFDTQSQRAELGYILAPFAWGRGLMHEALQALVDHAFGPLALRRRSGVGRQAARPSPGLGSGHRAPRGRPYCEAGRGRRPTSDEERSWGSWTR